MNEPLAIHTVYLGSSCQSPRSLSEMGLTQIWLGNEEKSFSTVGNLLVTDMVIATGFHALKSSNKHGKLD